MRVPMIGGPSDGLEYEIAEPLPQYLKVQGEPSPVHRWAGGDAGTGHRLTWPVYVYSLGRVVDPCTGRERPAYVL